MSRRVVPITDRSGREATALAYELLDAHEDTVRLALERGLPEDDVVWDVHLDYLRALQRAAREELARISGGSTL
jgi:hypothetical protein